jgi:quercetin dioxygenase-like cupin family protein
MSGDIDRTNATRITMRLLQAGLLAAATVHGPLTLAQTSAGGPPARILESHDMPGSDREMVMREVTIAPGAVAPLHHHTVPGLVFILEGTAESAYGNDPPRLYRAGESMQDRADVPHTLFRNTDPDRPLRILTFYVAAKGQPYVVTP